MLIETIATHVHSIVKELEAAGDTSSPGFVELKQFAKDLDLYESVRLTSEGQRYGLALLDRFLTIGRFVDQNLHTLHSSLLVTFLEERLATTTIPAVGGHAGDDSN